MVDAYRRKSVVNFPQCCLEFRRTAASYRKVSVDLLIIIWYFRQFTSHSLLFLCQSISFAVCSIYIFLLFKSGVCFVWFDETFTRRKNNTHVKIALLNTFYFVDSSILDNEWQWLIIITTFIDESFYSLVCLFKYYFFSHFSIIIFLFLARSQLFGAIYFFVSIFQAKRKSFYFFAFCSKV